MSFNAEYHVDVSKVDLLEFTKEVYGLSKPQGMGFMHYQEGGLSTEDAQEILDFYKTHPRIALRMDYVHGRACKMTVHKDEDGRLYINNAWYDHSEWQLQKLLEKFGIEFKGSDQ